LRYGSVSQELLYVFWVDVAGEQQRGASMTEIAELNRCGQRGRAILVATRYR
jgi:hypothetical protein